MKRGAFAGAAKMVQPTGCRRGARRLSRVLIRAVRHSIVPRGMRSQIL